jgi:hypothetical protein
VEVSPEFISSVTDAVMAEVGAWQARPLEPMYPVVFFDALRVKIREDAVVRNRAIYLALGVLPDGTRDILGLWNEGTEWARLRSRAPCPELLPTIAFGNRTIHRPKSDSRLSPKPRRVENGGDKITVTVNLDLTADDFHAQNVTVHWHRNAADA